MIRVVVIQIFIQPISLHAAMPKNTQMNEALQLILKSRMMPIQCNIMSFSSDRKSNNKTVS